MLEKLEKLTINQTLEICLLAYIFSKATVYTLSLCLLKNICMHFFKLTCISTTNENV